MSKHFRDWFACGLLLAASVVLLSCKPVQRELLFHKALSEDSKEAEEAVHELANYPSERTRQFLLQLAWEIPSKPSIPARNAAIEILAADKSNDNSPSLAFLLVETKPLELRLTVATALEKYQCTQSCVDQVYGRLRHLWVMDALRRMGPDAQPEEAPDLAMKTNLEKTLLIILGKRKRETARHLEQTDNIFFYLATKHNQPRRVDEFDIRLARELQAPELCFLMERYQRRALRGEQRKKVVLALKSAVTELGCKVITEQDLLTK